MKTQKRIIIGLGMVALVGFALAGVASTALTVLKLNTTLHVNTQGQSAYGLDAEPTFTEDVGPGGQHLTHPEFAAGYFQPSMTAVDATDISGVRIPTFAAYTTGTTTASGLKVDVPSGAATNLAINIPTGSIRITGQKATSGTRYLCIDTSGDVASSASACSGS